MNNGKDCRVPYKPLSLDESRALASALNLHRVVSVLISAALGHEDAQLRAIRLLADLGITLEPTKPS